MSRCILEIFYFKDKKKYLEAIKNFVGFTVYFTGYKQTRENMFVDEAKATGIAYRIIDQNMYRFFANIRLYNKIAETYKDLNAQLKKQAKQKGSATLPIPIRCPL